MYIRMYHTYIRRYVCMYVEDAQVLSHEAHWSERDTQVLSHQAHFQQDEKPRSLYSVRTEWMV